MFIYIVTEVLFRPFFRSTNKNSVGKCKKSQNIELKYPVAWCFRDMCRASAGEDALHYSVALSFTK